MIHTYLQMGLAALAEELKWYVDANPYSPLGVRRFVPVGDFFPRKVMVPGMCVHRKIDRIPPI